MTAKSTWKGGERRVAGFFGTVRTPLSGINGGITASDTLHEALFIEVKMRAKHAAVTLWDDTKAKATKEGKVPVVALQEKGRPGFWVLVHSDDLRYVAGEVGGG